MVNHLNGEAAAYPSTVTLEEELSNMVTLEEELSSLDWCSFSPMQEPPMLTQTWFLLLNHMHLIGLLWKAAAMARTPSQTPPYGRLMTPSSLPTAIRRDVVSYSQVTRELPAQGIVIGSPRRFDVIPPPALHLTLLQVKALCPLPSLSYGLLGPCMPILSSTLINADDMVFHHIIGEIIIFHPFSKTLLMNSWSRSAYRRKSRSGGASWPERRVVEVKELRQD